MSLSLHVKLLEFTSSALFSLSTVLMVAAASFLLFDSAFDMKTSLDGRFYVRREHPDKPHIIMSAVFLLVATVLVFVATNGYFPKPRPPNEVVWTPYAAVPVGQGGK